MVANIQQYPEFYRRNGTLRIEALAELEPVLIKRLPISSSLHFLGNEENPNLDNSDPLMKGYSDRVFFHNVTEHDPEHTSGVRKAINIQASVVNFLKVNRSFKHLPDFKLVKAVTPRQLMVYNYAWLDSLYRYPDSKVSDFNKTESKLWALFSNIKKINELSPRNHFIVLPVPLELIPKSIMDMRSIDEPLRLSNIFRTEDQRFLRHIWLLLNPELKKHSVFSILSDDNLETSESSSEALNGKKLEANLKSINLMFKSFDGKYAILNMGYLYSWVKGNPNLTFMGTPSTKPYTEVQKYYLRGMMTLQTIDFTGVSALAQEKDLAEKLKQTQDQENLEEEGSHVDERFLQDRDLEQSEIHSRSQLGVDPTKSGKDKTSSDTSTSKPVDRTASVTDDPVSTEEVSEKQKEQDIDKDIQALEDISKRKLDSRLSSTVKKKTITDEEMEEYTSDIPDSVESIKASIFTSKTPEEAVISKLDELADTGRLSGAEYRKKVDMAKKASTNPDPYGSGKSIAEASKVTKEDLTIPEASIKMNVPATVLDSSMANSSLNVMGSKYNKEVIYKDILQCVQYAQRGGVIIKNHDVSTSYSSLGAFDTHTLEIVPVSGQPSLIRARIPKVSEEGTFESRANKYSLRSQKVDIPIRKIGANRVGLTSYYGKTFIDRATKKSNSSLAYVINRLSAATINPDEYLKDVSPGNVFDNYFVAPYIYSGLSENFQSFRAGEYVFDFNPKGLRATIDQEVLKKLEVQGTIVVGYSDKDQLILIDINNDFHIVTETGLSPIGDIYNLLRLDKTLAPVDFAEVKVFSKGIAVGVFLGQDIGFRRLVKMLGAKHRLVMGKQRKGLEPHEYSVQFRDLAYIFDRREIKNSLILGGFTDYEKETKLFDAISFDSPDVYLRLLEAKGLNVAYLNEMGSLRDMFVDPITERILKEMNEPVTFNELLMRSCDLLQTYYYPASQDANYQRIRGYERFAGFFYKELTQSIRAFKSRNRTGRAKVEMSPYQLWTTLTRDATVKHAEDINPVQALKIAQEAVTYVGEGGRGKESMNKESRAYMEADLGVTSESSVDSSDVGINTFLSADPGFASLDGLNAKGRKLEATNILSTSALLAPFSSFDDVKRLGFISIQQGHTIATDGYSAPMVRTGYESVIGMRTGDMFAKVASMDGVVLSITDKGILVKYKDGKEQGYPLGTLYGKAEGSMYPHTLKTDMVVGQKFKKDEYLTYNTKFFEPDPILPGGIVYKGSLTARVVLMEVPDTHEDSSTISPELAERLKATVTKVKTFTVNFKQGLTNVVKVGQKLKPEDILMSIEDEITSMDSSFGDASLQILSERSKNSPKSGSIGVVSSIEVFYHGEKSDMSSSLKSLADKSDRVKSDESKDRGLPHVNGYVNGDFSVNGVPLAVNKAVIKIYINVDDTPGAGDKIVFANQIKSVIGETMPYTIRTESGDIIDAKMGAKSFAARIVRSLVMIGLRSTTLDVIGKAATKAYRAT